MASDGPRFRRDLQPNAVEVEGVQYVDVTDPRGGEAFRFYDFEHAVALSFDGRPLAEVSDGLRETAGIDLTPDQLAEFAARLRELGFLDGDADEELSPAATMDDMNTPAMQLPDEPEPVAAAARSDHAEIEDDAEKTTATPSLFFGREAEPEPPRPALRLAPPPDEADDRDAVPFAAPDRTAEPPAAPPALRLAERGGAPESPAGTPDRTSPAPTTPPVWRAEPPAAAPVRTADEPPAPQPPPLRLPDEPAAKSATPPPLRLADKPAAPPLRPTDEPAAKSATPPPLRLADKPAAPPLRPTDEPVAPVGRPEPARKEATPPPVTVIPPPVAAPAAASAAKQPAPATTKSAPAPARRRSRATLYAVLGMVAAALLGLLLFQRLSIPATPAPLDVKTIAPKPTSVYRFFPTKAKVQREAARTLAFPASGKVAAVLPAGTMFGAGDVLAMTEAGRPLAKQLDHHRERLAHYEEVLAQSQARGDRPEARQAELKIAEKKQLVSDTLARLARFAVVAPGAGEVAEPLVAVGDKVTPGQAALSAKSSVWRAEVELSPAEVAVARRLGFCRIELEGRQLPCTLSDDGAAERSVAVDIPSDPALAAGKQVRLARARFEGVFVLPASAVLEVGSSQRVYVAGPHGRAEARAVAVADRADGEAVVTQGLDQGDEVIVNPPPLIHPGAPLRLAKGR